MLGSTSEPTFQVIWTVSPTRYVRARSSTGVDLVSWTQYVGGSVKKTCPAWTRVVYTVRMSAAMSRRLCGGDENEAIFESCRRV
jgi:hypothetical protein